MLVRWLSHRYKTVKNASIAAVTRRKLVTAAPLVLQWSAANMIQTGSTAHASPEMAMGQASAHMAASSLMPAALAGNCLVKPLLLVSDLDDTLLGHQTTVHDEATSIFKAVWERSRALGVPCKLAINTGRTLPLFEQAWQQRSHLLPEPDIMIGGVGTRIYYNTREGWVEDTSWTQQMNIKWDSSKARHIMDELVNKFGSTSVEYRDPVEMHDHKLTVLYKADLRDQLLPELHTALKEAGIEATVIEGGSAAGVPWRFIDLVPRRAGKGSALQYVRQRLGFDEASTVAAGDSCNDLLMLQQCRLSIAVGNSVSEVKQWAQHAQQAQHQQEASSTSRQQQVVYLARQPVAAGVLEGLAAMGFLDHKNV